MKFREDVNKITRNLELTSDEELVWLLIHVHKEIIKRWPSAEFNLGNKLDDKMVSGWRCGHCNFFYFNYSPEKTPTDCTDWFWEESARLTRDKK